MDKLRFKGTLMR